MKKGKDRSRKRRRVFPLPVGEDVRREVDFHIEMAARELIDSGWAPDAARAEAERRFGDIAQVETECREIEARHRRSTRRGVRLDTVVQDIRFGVRTLLRRPLFAVVAVVTLGLGVGANAAVFSVIDRLLLAPLPFPEADRLVRLWEVSPSGAEIAFSEPNFFDARARLRSVHALATHPTYWFGGPVTVLGGSRPVRRRVAFVSGDFFRIMAVPAARGRLPDVSEARPDAVPVAVVSHAFWSDLLDGAQDLSTLAIEVGSTRYPVVGVMPRGYRYPEDTHVWIPAEPATGASRTSHNFAVVGRLRAGVTAAEAAREAPALARGLKDEFGDGMTAVDFRVKPLREELYGDYRQPLLLLLAAAGLVLLVACANLASTLLAGSHARAREFAVRAALGAGRGRVVRQLFTESLVLAVGGALVGMGLAAVALRAIGALSPSAALGAAGPASASAFVFALVASFAAALLFGLLPALRATRTDVSAVLREGGRGGTGARSFVWSGIVITEAALAIVLLVSSGLLLRALRATLDADPGFDADGVVVAALSVPSSLYPDDTVGAVLLGRLLDEVRTVPGVSAAGLISHVPFGGAGINGGLVIEGLADVEPYADYRAASAGYFETLRIPLLEGRLFDARDGIGSAGVALVSRSFVNRFLDGKPVLGTRLRDLSNDSWYYGRDAVLTIVGVVDDVRDRGFLTSPAPTVYVCSCQRAYWMANPSLVVRAETAPATAVPAVRAAIAAVEPAMPADFTVYGELMKSTVADRRFSLFVLATFAGIALLLAAVGIYGVVSYAVAQRTREMGIRLALGARPREVAGMLLRRAMGTVAIGVGVGVIGSLIASRLIASQLAGAPGFDGATVLATVAVLASAALLASWIPARRLIRLDPLQSLRAE